ncbi:MAG: NAD(P)/FAD-dependent oxidoreductase [Rubripirellula sp.]
MTKKIVIIGGGVIGLSTAWHCQKAGHDVTVIDRAQEQRDGCSFGNAGMIVPSHFVPLAAPGMIRLGLKWMWNPESPFYIRPRVSWDLLSWLWQFKQSCTRRHVDQAAPLLRDLHLASRSILAQLEPVLEQAGEDGFGLAQNGLLMLCKSEATFDEEAETANAATQLGIEAQVLDAKATKRLEPNFDMDVRGAVYYPRDCHLSPQRLMGALQSQLTAGGCQFHWSTVCTGFTKRNNRVEQVQTSVGEMDADEIILCGGVWSSQIARELEISLPMQAGKGYSVTLDDPKQLPSICSILTEARVAVTPMGSTLRFGGTMEIAGVDESISESRVRGIVRSVPDYFPAFDESDFQHCQPWVGLRPCSPDGLPYLGRPKRWQNVIVSTGHAMMGISLAMISGKLAQEFVDQQTPSIDRMSLLAPDRFRQTS